MISCKDIVKVFPDGSGCTSTILDCVNLEIKNGEFVALTGKSGSGKTTLLNIIGLLEDTTSGQVLIGNENWQEKTRKEQALFRNQKIGYIFQSFYLESEYSVYKNVELPLIVAGIPRKERKPQVMECLEKVGMLPKAKSKAKLLSGGEKQRACIARAIVCNPEIILADEPCGNLDDANTAKIMELLAELKNEKRTIIMVTHSMEDAGYADRKIAMHGGKVYEENN